MDEGCGSNFRVVEFVTLNLFLLLELNLVHTALEVHSDSKS